MRRAFLFATTVSILGFSAPASSFSMPEFYIWPAADAIIPFSTVSAPASVYGLETIADGIHPALGSDWQSQAWWTDSTAEIEFALPGLFTLGNIGVLHDDNDTYTLYGSTDGQSWELIASLGPTDPANGGMTAAYTFPPFDAPSYRALKLTASGGDGMFGIGEIAFSGVSAVPEVSSTAMLLAGLGLVGALARRRA